MKKIFFPLGMITILLLTACSILPNKSATKEQQNSTISNLKENPEKPSDADPSANPGTSSFADSEIFAKAITSENADECSKINDDTRKKECLAIITSAMVNEEAVSKMDSSICKKLEFDTYRRECEAKVQDLINRKEAADKLTQKAQDEQTMAAKYLETNNSEGCKKIDDQNIQEQCQINIILKKAFEKKDPAICDQIDDKNIVAMCKDSI